LEYLKNLHQTPTHAMLHPIVT